MDMIKRVLKKKEGFTLVELIVVLVILAILAAILVPTLTGYINQANTEKNYSTAQTVRVAAQSVASDRYGRNNKLTTITVKKASTNTTTGTTGDYNETASKQSVTGLAGVDTSNSGVSDYSFTFTNGALDKDATNTVTIDNHTYTYDATNNQWSAQ